MHRALRERRRGDEPEKGSETARGRERERAELVRASGPEAASSFPSKTALNLSLLGSRTIPSHISKIRSERKIYEQRGNDDSPPGVARSIEAPRFNCPVLVGNPFGNSFADPSAGFARGSPLLKMERGRGSYYGPGLVNVGTRVNVEFGDKLASLASRSVTLTTFFSQRGAIVAAVSSSKT